MKRQLHSPFSRTRGGVGMEIAVCCCGYNKVDFNNEFPNFIWLNVEKLVVPCKSIAEQVSFEIQNKGFSLKLKNWNHLTWKSPSFNIAQFKGLLTTPLLAFLNSVRHL